MYIKHHLIYYFTCAILIILSYLENAMFFILLLGIVLLIKKIINPIIIIMFSICVFGFVKNINSNVLTKADIQGRVIQLTSYSAYIKTREGLVKVQLNKHQLELQTDVILTLDQIREISSTSNDNLFNYEKYAKSIQLNYQGRIIQVNQISKNNIHYFIYKHIESYQEPIKEYLGDLLFNYKSSNIKEQFEPLTIHFLLSISGIQFRILVSFIQFILRKKRENVRKFVASTTILIYLFLLDFPIASSRFCFTFIAYQYLNNYLSKLDCISIIGMIQLVLNPYIVFNQGFVYAYSFSIFFQLIRYYKHKKMLSILFSYTLSIWYQSTVNLFLPLNIMLLTPIFKIMYFGLFMSLVFKPFAMITHFLITIVELVSELIKPYQIEVTIGKPHLMTLFIMITFSYLKIRAKTTKKVVLITIQLCTLVLQHKAYLDKYYYQVTIIDVGQGSSILIVFPRRCVTILIDTGIEYQAKNTVIPYIKSLGITSIDYLFVSHPDFDHNGGVSLLKQSFNVKSIIESMRQDIVIEGIIFKNLNPRSEVLKNEDSIVLLFEIQMTTFLYMGDATTKEELKIITDFSDLEVDVLVLGHHGSQTSSSEPFLYTLHPKVSIISASKYNAYHLPHNDVIQRLDYLNLFYLNTATSGMIHFKLYNNQFYLYTFR